MRRGLIGLVLAAVLCACGDNDKEPAAPVLSKGQFLDSAVEGLGYEGSGSAGAGPSGLTGSDGGFDYRNGNTLRFLVGSITLGSAAGAPFVMPSSLFPENAQAATNLARFLLTLDADRNPANGIQISATVRGADAGGSIDSGSFRVSDSAFTSSAAANFARSANGDGNRRLIGSALANAHLACTQQDIADGRFDNDACPAASDADNDGVIDSEDQCAATPPGVPVDAQGCTAPDADGDGVADDRDVCPGTPAGESVDARGCAASQLDQDADGDGVGNAVDQCPATPAGEAVDAAGCSASQRDSDGDGVSDPLDSCPTTPEGELNEVNESGCGPSERDSDGDGVTDKLDACPQTPAGADVNPSGCTLTARSRYSLNNQCFAVLSRARARYLVASGAGYAASADTVEAAHKFFLKPATLGDYLLHDQQRRLIVNDSSGAAAPVATSTTAAADESAIWTLRAVGDATTYPAAPAYDTEPAAAQVADYQGFVDPDVLATRFVLRSATGGQALAVDGSGALISRTPVGGDAEAFSFEPVDAAQCGPYPEARSNVVGETFKGSTEDGRVLGMADVHVHISATTFLGRTQWGSPFHKLGVEHALGQCDDYHGPDGSRDEVGFVYSGDTDGHDTTGWPTFPDWPSRDSLTHEAIYWKWLERAWQAGLRVAVNDLVENQTLCELQRQGSIDVDPQIDCNEMNSAGRQAGSMYAMQDYIDAQYGGRGKGWFRIVHDAEQARSAIEDGKLAVVLGIEISNFLNCQVTYNPLRTQEPFEETGEGGIENTYTCAMTETGADNEIQTQLERLHGLGVRQIISIHEFDNPFGGNGIFSGVLNLGNRENSGGIPAGSPPPEGVFDFALDPESPTGEFWTTYDCPLDNQEGFSGYFWGSSGGTHGRELRSFGLNDDPQDPTAACEPMGQGGRYGGPTNCYPDRHQCNARWMTPIGLYLYKKLMEMGFIIDFDHLELAMKDQLLDLTEAQPIAYPLVSTHGTFGGTTNDQARRVLRNHGFLYPSLGNGPSLIGDMNETLTIFNQAWADVPAAERPLFGFGFGTDTNGLSEQASPRDSSQVAAHGEIVYPYTLFRGPVFDALPDFDGIAGVSFQQPEERGLDDNGRTWHLDADGSAHYGMLSGMVQEVRLQGIAEERNDYLQYLFNAAEVYLRTWERTGEASEAINAAGGPVEPPGLLKAAPKP